MRRRTPMMQGLVFKDWCGVVRTRGSLVRRAMQGVDPEDRADLAMSLPEQLVLLALLLRLVSLALLLRLVSLALLLRQVSLALLLRLVLLALLLRLVSLTLILLHIVLLVPTRHAVSAPWRRLEDVRLPHQSTAEGRDMVTMWIFGGAVRIRTSSTNLYSIRRRVWHGYPEPIKGIWY
jgi:hypothetical protein